MQKEPVPRGRAAPPDPVPGQSMILASPPEPFNPHEEHRLVLAESGVVALARLSDEEFTERLDEMRRARARMHRMMKELLRPEVDYATLPGTKKATLLQPGAEQLCEMTRLFPGIHVERAYGDGKQFPLISALVVCTLYRGSLQGLPVAQGIGAANSHEARYRWRKERPRCPNCGAAAVTVSRKEPGTYYCNRHQDGCGMTIEGGAELMAKAGGRAENPDIWDLEQAVVAQASKRAFVAATRRGAHASGMFTQDIEQNPRAHLGMDYDRGVEREQVEAGREAVRPRAPAERFAAGRGKISIPQVRLFWRRCTQAMARHGVSEDGEVRSQAERLLVGMGLDPSPAELPSEQFDAVLEKINAWTPDMNRGRQQQRRP